MEIKVLGPGCANCTKLYEIAQEAVKRLAIEATVLKVTDMLQISMAGVMSTPGLVVNGKVRHMGKPLPTVEKVMELIRQEP